jgi:hypothetical protein
VLLPLRRTSPPSALVSGSSHGFFIWQTRSRFDGQSFPTGQPLGEPRSGGRKPRGGASRRPNERSEWDRMGGSATPPPTSCAPFGAPCAALLGDSARHGECRRRLHRRRTRQLPVIHTGKNYRRELETRAGIGLEPWCCDRLCANQAVFCDRLCVDNLKSCDRLCVHNLIYPQARLPVDEHVNWPAGASGDHRRG